MVGDGHHSHNHTRAVITVLLTILLTTGTVPGADYHLSPQGDDSHDGLTPATAWRTIGRVNGTTLEPGDRVLFEGGQTFPGTLVFDAASKGTPDARIVVTSYGMGRATIDAGAGDGIRLNGVEYFDVRNINVRGLGRKDGNNNGRGILPIGCKHLVIDGVEATGFQRAGVEFQGCHDLHITRVCAHNNGYAGISSGPERIGWSTNVRIDHCRAINNPGHPKILNNHSGSGIVLYRVNGGIGEYCEAAENGWDMPRDGNGPVGIWAAYCRNMVFQYNIAHNNKTSPNGYDGGGFDFDGDVHDSILQYNYSYDNMGAGYLLCTWDAKYPNSNNTVRYNISENDGGAHHRAGIHVHLGSAQDNVQVHNNVIFNSDGRHGVTGWTPTGFAFRNNIFVLRGNGRFVQGVGEGLFQGNLYWNLDGLHNWDGHTSLDAWRAATGKEMFDGEPVGMNLDPLLTRASSGERITDPTKLPELFAYMLRPGSPCIDAGLDLRARFGIDPGQRDFYGHPIPQGDGFDIGAHETESLPTVTVDSQVRSIATDGPSTLRPVDPQRAPELFVWTDTCNVYVIREGDAAILIDLGDGSVLDHLARIGVRHVEWVLFTHHHREQCQGAPRLRGTGAKIAAPEAERALFERPTDFRRMNVRLGDPFTVHGASYVRPPTEAIPLDRTFRDGDTFVWRGREFRCIETPGNSPGAMTYLLRQEHGLLAFSGDVMLDDAKMHTWFDTEWDYGFGAGIRALQKSAVRLAQLEPVVLLPSHGPVVRQPVVQLRSFVERLANLERLYLRGYGVEGASAQYQDRVSVPTVVPHVGQISPHLFKIRRPSFWGNFGLILADSGRALVVDCGLLDEQFLDTVLDGLQEHFGLKAIDAIIITHMHGDHFLQAPHLRRKWDAPIWALENMVDKMERPERFDYAALVQAYGHKNPDGSPMTGVRVDRALRPGETFEWEGHQFTVDWMPGQTEFALCLHGEIDGRKVAFTGDNIFGDPDDPTQTGHEAVVARNSAIFEEGYMHGARFLQKLQPDLIVGGHSYVIDRPQQMIERFVAWAHEIRDAYVGLSAEEDYRYMFDPYWVRAEPYRVSARAGEGVEVTLHIRSFLSRTQQHSIRTDAPPGIDVESGVLEATIAPYSAGSFPLRLKMSADLKPGVYIVAFDITLDDRRYGQWFDMIVSVEP